jgi:hypothetical protein
MQTCAPHFNQVGTSFLYNQKRKKPEVEETFVGQSHPQWNTLTVPSHLLKVSQHDQKYFIPPNQSYLLQKKLNHEKGYRTSTRELYGPVPPLFNEVEKIRKTPLLYNTNSYLLNDPFASAPNASYLESVLQLPNENNKLRKRYLRKFMQKRKIPKVHRFKKRKKLLDGSFQSTGPQTNIKFDKDNVQKDDAEEDDAEEDDKEGENMTDEDETEEDSEQTEDDSQPPPLEPPSPIMPVPVPDESAEVPEVLEDEDKYCGIDLGCHFKKVMDDPDLLKKAAVKTAKYAGTGLAAAGTAIIIGNPVGATVAAAIGTAAAIDAGVGLSQKVVDESVHASGGSQKLANNINTAIGTASTVAGIMAGDPSALPERAGVAIASMTGGAITAKGVTAASKAAGLSDTTTKVLSEFSRSAVSGGISGAHRASTTYKNTRTGTHDRLYQARQKGLQKIDEVGEKVKDFFSPGRADRMRERMDPHRQGYFDAIFDSDDDLDDLLNENDMAYDHNVGEPEGNKPTVETVMNNVRRKGENFRGVLKDKFDEVKRKFTPDRKRKFDQTREERRNNENEYKYDSDGNSDDGIGVFRSKNQRKSSRSEGKVVSAFGLSDDDDFDFDDLEFERIGGPPADDSDFERFGLPNPYPLPSSSPPPPPLPSPPGPPRGPPPSSELQQRADMLRRGLTPSEREEFDINMRNYDVPIAYPFRQPRPEPPSPFAQPRPKAPPPVFKSLFRRDDDKFEASQSSPSQMIDRLRPRNQPDPTLIPNQNRRAPPPLPSQRRGPPPLPSQPRGPPPVPSQPPPGPRVLRSVTLKGLQEQLQKEEKKYSRLDRMVKIAEQTGSPVRTRNETEGQHISKKGAERRRIIDLKIQKANSIGLQKEIKKRMKNFKPN